MRLVPKLETPPNPGDSFRFLENEVISLTRLGLLTWRLKRKVVFNSEVWKTALNLDDQPNVVDFLSAVSTAYNIECKGYIKLFREEIVDIATDFLCTTDPQPQRSRTNLVRILEDCLGQVMHSRLDREDSVTALSSQKLPVGTVYTLRAEWCSKRPATHSTSKCQHWRRYPATYLENTV
jgi:hypothetical protein